jgi:CDP-diglyceride synthetase
MILKLPEVLQGLNYYQGISLILWIIVIVLLFLSAVLFFKEALGLEQKQPRSGNLAYGIFSLFFGMTRMVYVIAVYMPNSYDFFINLGYIFLMVALISIIYVIETQVITSTKKIFLLINSIAFIIALFTLIGVASRYFALTMLYILAPISIFVILGMYLYIFIKSKGKVRQKALIILCGFLLVTLAHFMDSEAFIGALPFIPLEITPIIMSAGIVIFTYGHLYISIR